MKFVDKQFKIMHISDIHQKPRVNHDTLTLITKSLDKEKPDLVVFTGDFLKGYGFAFVGKNKKTKIFTALSIILNPLLNRNIPFTFTFGNHDLQGGLSKDDILSYMKTFDNFIPGDKSNSPGTRRLFIYGRDTNKPIFSIYMIDTWENIDKPNYNGGISAEDLRWFVNIRDEELYIYGKKTPALIFQHIPLEQYYDSLTKISKKSYHDVKSFIKPYKGFYILPNKSCFESLSQAPTVSNSGLNEFNIYKSDGSVLGIFCGHDHRNNYVRTLNGIDLGYTPSCGFDEYGLGIDRGIRIFSLKQNNGNISYESNVISFKDLVGKKTRHPIKNLWFSMIPSSKDKALYLIMKIFSFLTIFLIASTLLLCLYKFLL